MWLARCLCWCQAAPGAAFLSTTPAPSLRCRKAPWTYDIHLPYCTLVVLIACAAQLTELSDVQGSFQMMAVAQDGRPIRHFDAVIAPFKLKVATL